MRFWKTSGVVCKPRVFEQTLEKNWFGIVRYVYIWPIYIYTYIGGCFMLFFRFGIVFRISGSQLFCFSAFLRFPASLLLCFFASLLLWISLIFCFSVSLPLCFYAFPCFSAFPALLLCFLLFPAFLLTCNSAFPCFSFVSHIVNKPKEVSYNTKVHKP